MDRCLWHSCIILLVFCNVALAGSLDRCPSSFNRLGEYKTADGETCYAFVNTEKTWVDARQHCWGWGGELIMIKDQAKMNFVIHTLNSVLRWRNNGVWIGAHDRRGRGWEWTNGERLSWGYWAPGQPSKTGGFISIEDCALMRRGDGWRWHDYHCDSSLFYTYKFICQFRKQPPTTTTSTTTTTTTTTTTPIPSTTTTTSTRLSTSSISPTTWTNSPTTHKTIEPDLMNIKFEKHGINTDKLKQVEGSVSSVVGGDSGTDNSSNDTGILAAIIVGGAILILIIAVGTLLLRRRRQKKYEEPSVHFQNLAYSRVSQGGQDGNGASNVYMDTNEMNRLYEEVNKQVNHGVNCFSGTVLDIPLPRESEDNQGEICCGGEREESDLKKLNNTTHVAIPSDTKNPPEVVENHYVDMSTGTNKAKETNRLKEASRVVDPAKPSNLGVDREPMPLPVYANSTENLSQERREPSSTLSTQSMDSTYMNSQEGFQVDEEGYMSPRSTLYHNSESDTEIMGAEKDPLYDEIR
uniref:Myosin-G heavy chain-like isoform X1 n=1 Tax=Crassostrea virginica TaxID=6565 RepID=A0A8B8CSQ6_CRAVI|nr:myosin-G heavy chain-like isoform X1 [Crassostrea virginica]